MYILQPCHENWSAMTPAEHGRVCASCNTLVADMTRLSNEEILHLIGKGVHCGRFYADQLEVPVIEPGWLTQWFGRLDKKWTIVTMLTMLEISAPSELSATAIKIEQREQGRANVKEDTVAVMPGYIQGRVLKANTAAFPVEKREVFIYTNKGRLIGSVTTDTNGFFLFSPCHIKTPAMLIR